MEDLLLLKNEWGWKPGRNLGPCEECNFSKGNCGTHKFYTKKECDDYREAPLQSKINIRNIPTDIDISKYNDVLSKMYIAPTGDLATVDKERISQILNTRKKAKESMKKIVSSLKKQISKKKMVGKKRTSKS